MNHDIVIEALKQTIRQRFADKSLWTTGPDPHPTIPAVLVCETLRGRVYPFYITPTHKDAQENYNEILRTCNTILLGLCPAFACLSLPSVTFHLPAEPDKNKLAMFRLMMGDYESQEKPKPAVSIFASDGEWQQIWMAAIDEVSYELAEFVTFDPRLSQCVIHHMMQEVRRCSSSNATAMGG